MALGTRVQFEDPHASRAIGIGTGLSERLSDTIDRGVNYLLSLQASEGYWMGELEADTTLESDYIFYLQVINKANPERIAKLANYVRRRQLEDGGWNIYFGGPSELNATIKAYVALRIAGDAPECDHMQRAAKRAHELGGLESANSYTRLYLALVGAVGWQSPRS
jgi:squalene-hopene/tetraprenyl-beta-curcumene cyclase